MCAVERDDRPGRVERVVGPGELAVAVERGAAVPAPADHVLLLLDADPVPELDEHPDQPDDLVAAVRGPGRLAGRARLDPDQPVHLRGQLGVRVGDAVHEAHQVARRGARRAGRAGEPVDPPHRLHAAAGVPGDVAQRVQHGVGAARGQLQAQVAAALGRVQVVVGERGHRGQPGRLARGQPVAVVEQRGADADRDGQAVRDHGRPEHPGVRRRRADALRRRGAARGQEPGPVGDGAQQVGQLAAAVRGDVERHHEGLPLRLVHDARLVDAVERDRGQAAGPAVLASAPGPGGAACADR